MEDNINSGSDSSEPEEKKQVEDDEEEEADEETGDDEPKEDTKQEKTKKRKTGDEDANPRPSKRSKPKKPSEGEGEEEKKKKPRKKRKQSKPSKPNAWQVFRNERTPALAKGGKGGNQMLGDRSKKLSAEWKSMSAAERQQYKAKADALQVDYEKRLQEWIAANPEEHAQAQAAKAEKIKQAKNTKGKKKPPVAAPVAWVRAERYMGDLANDDS